PYRQARKPASASRAEGGSIVGSYGRWQANFTEDPLHGAFHACRRRFDDADLDQVTARGIRDRQRIAPLSIKGAKPALEINRPFVVGRCGRSHNLASSNGTTTPAALFDQAGTLEDVPDRRGRWPGDFRRLG